MARPIRCAPPVTRAARRDAAGDSFMSQAGARRDVVVARGRSGPRLHHSLTTRRGKRDTPMGAPRQIMTRGGRYGTTPYSKCNVGPLRYRTRILRVNENRLGVLHQRLTAKSR